MNFKKATICGILSYFFVYACSTLTNDSVHMKFFFFNTHLPLWIVFGALIFGVVYVRTLHEHEIFEGFLAGLYFAIISIILDMVTMFFTHNINIGSNFTKIYFAKISYMYIIYPIVITSLGYLANFEVQLK
ncbi:hypothetical protein [uncultured Methanobrevibacter sp.]|uniref:hypothetical protein n=1 Tax=uncultured Methanobrevibacter sp. TaxID=253161 RepID=UPI0025D35901|nr:hypothetical protein [uncultured Methanobrevibacter sp.]